jgi:hypothetical protein
MTDEKAAIDRPPYPRIGELYRALAGALDTKARDRTVDRLAREGEYDWSVFPVLREELVTSRSRDATDDAFAEVVGRFVDRVHASYLDLVTKVPLDSLNRNEALPLLVEHYFAYQGAGLLLDIKDKFGGPDLMILLDTEKHPVEVVFDWLDQETGVDLVRAAFPESTGADRSDRELIARWKNGAQIPDLPSIKRLAHVLWERAGAAVKQRVPDLRRWMVVARALSWFEKESPLPIRAFMGRHLLSGLPELDLGRALSVVNHRGGERFSALTMPALQLYEDLKRTTPKAPGDQACIRARLDHFEQLAKVTDPEGRIRFHVAWLFGRWHALSGRYEEAVAHYERAAELAHYRAGHQQKPIVEEALVLAAFVGGKRSLLKRLKHRAVVFGLFADPSGGDVIEDWEVEQLHQQFHRLFPPQGRFQEAAVSAHAPLPILMVNEEDLARLSPDFRNPDRVRTVRACGDRTFRKPQLHLFASVGQVDAVRALLEHGASVDQLDTSNGSALLCAIQRMLNTGDGGVLGLILDRTHSKATLDSVTTKKRHTPLICAVRSGAPDIVERLLAMGATADRRGQVEDVTPLYCCLTILGRLGERRPQKQSMLRNHESVRREQMRRHDVPGAGVFGDAQILLAKVENPRHQRIYEAAAAAMEANKLERLSERKALDMVELLLKGGANPNAVHDYPTLGRTPMMLAAEIDSVDAFDLMLRNGGSPYQKDAQGLDCASLAFGSGSRDIVGYLRKINIL